MGSFLYAAGLLGRRTAELHRALARSTPERAFDPEPLTAAEQWRIQQKVQTELERVLGVLEKQMGKLPEPQQQKIQSVLKRKAGLRLAYTEKDFERIEKGKIRCHGDYHLGQVLWSKNDFAILDFEGEPARPMQERRAKQSPLKDVAGMLRSFHYASHAGLLKASAERPADFAKLEPVAHFWCSWAAATFLAEYRRVVAAAGCVPENDKAFEALLELYVFEKALYEVLYELNNRPAWIGIPLEGITGLIAPPETAVH
jgi:maltose alpha-D-glucosyltransferase / alpha-amylase